MPFSPLPSFCPGIGAVLCFFFAPFIGRLSDSIGRTPVLLVSVLLTLWTPVAILMNIRWAWSLYWYYVAEFLFRLSPSIAASLAYVADVTAPSERGLAFAMVMGMMSICKIVGPLISQQLSLEWCLYVLIGARIFHIGFVWCLIPESLPAEKRRDLIEPGDLQPFKVFTILTRSPLFIRLAICVLLAYVTLYGSVEIAALYAKEKCHVSQHAYASVAMVAGITGICILFLLMPILQRLIDTRRILMVGVAGQCASAVCNALAVDQSTLMWGYGVQGLNSLTMPSVAAIKSQNVADSEQGAVQGALAGIQQLSDVVGSLVFSGLFTLGVHNQNPSLPYWVGAFFSLLALFVALLLPLRSVPSKVVFLADSSSSERHSRSDDGAALDSIDRVGESVNESVDAANVFLYLPTDQSVRQQADERKQPLLQ
jgi:DHA1 family tetracycline resistance protein-like MFS transporter